jgi:hypothetical protein
MYVFVLQQASLNSFPIPKSTQQYQDPENPWEGIALWSWMSLTNFFCMANLITLDIRIIALRIIIASHFQDNHRRSLPHQRRMYLLSLVRRALGIPLVLLTLFDRFIFQFRTLSTLIAGSYLVYPSLQVDQFNWWRRSYV